VKLSERARTRENLHFYQIWFQNRRQNDRRKSRPLLPHEMVPHFRNSVPQVLLDSALPGNIAQTQSHRASWFPGEITCSTGGDDLERSSSRASSIHDLLNPPSSLESHTKNSSEPLLAGKDGLQSSQSSTSISGHGTSNAKVQREGANGIPTSPQDAEPSLGGVKRSHDEMTEKERSAEDVTLAQVLSLTSHGSHVRLSMSLDGAVKVKTNDEETPSPPKQRAPAPTIPPKPAGGLQKSKSAVLLGGPFSEGPAGKSKAKAIGDQFGRSRDARTWEFYCDGDAREALSAHAENERAGSAVGAINLIRSQSQKSRLQIMTERSGSSNARKPSVSQRGVKPKIYRAKSSMARLQDTDQSLVKPPTKEGRSSHVRSPSGDSDKENWAPGTRSSHHPLRRQHISTNRHPGLGSEDHRPSHARSASGPANGTGRGVMRQLVHMDKENIDRSDQRTSLFGEGGKGEDLDCIQGLLSLSQGAWR
jgi:hypothetical protein